MNRQPAAQKSERVNKPSIRAICIPYTGIWNNVRIPGSGSTIYAYQGDANLSPPPDPYKYSGKDRTGLIYDWTQWVKARHGKTNNVLFQDGHAEALNPTIMCAHFISWSYPVERHRRWSNKFAAKEENMFRFMLTR